MQYYLLRVDFEVRRVKINIFADYSVYVMEIIL